MSKEKLYLDSGYLNFDFVMNRKPQLPFIFLIGGRGTGKTYGAIKWIIEHGEHALFMRRTQDEVDTIMNDRNLSAAKTPVKDMGKQLFTRKISKKNVILSYADSEEDPAVDFITTCALSTFASLRGFSAAEYKYLFFDEFIKEPHVHALKQEGRALFNAYETVSRNRELAGLPALRMVCMSNSEDIYNPIFAEFNLENEYLRMMERGENYRIVQDQIAIYNLSDSPISEAKADTAIYKLGNENFNKMALANKFTVDADIIRSMSLKGMKPICNYNGVGFYSGKGIIYAAAAENKSVESFGTTEREKKGLLSTYSILRFCYTRGALICENVKVLGVIRELITY